MAFGEVTYFNGTYGFIEEEDSGESYFFHLRDIVDDPDDIYEGCDVMFSPGCCPKGPCARNVVLLSETGDDDDYDDYDYYDDDYYDDEDDDDDYYDDYYDDDDDYEEDDDDYEDEDDEDDEDYSKFYQPVKKDRFIKVGSLRIKISNIMEYEGYTSYDSDGGVKGYCIEITTYLSGKKRQCWNMEKERDYWLEYLDKEMDKFYS